MKRILLISIFAVVLSMRLQAATTSRFADRVAIGTEAQAASASVATAAGDLYVAGAVESAVGIVNASEVFFDVAAASTFSYVAGNGVLGIISTTTLVSAGTSYTLAKGDYTNTGDPRNVVAVLDFGAGTSTMTVVGTLVISGTDARGNAIVESLSVSTTSATGNYAYSSITSLTLSVASITPTTNANAYISIGTGVKIGLANSITASGDIRKVNEGGSAATTYSVNTTYNTITFQNAPNGAREYKVTYNVKSK